MADNNLFDIKKLKSLFDRFFKMFSNFIDGYTVKDGKVTNRSGGVTNSIIISPKVGDKNVDVKIDLTATNIGTAFKDMVKGIENLSYESIKKSDKTRELITTLVGVELSPSNSGEYFFQKKDESLGEKEDFDDISLETAKEMGRGILGINLAEVVKNGKLSDKSFQWWYNKAFNNIVYSLYCEAADSSMDAGKVDNQKLAKAVEWIGRYIKYIGNPSLSAQGENEGEEEKLDRNAKNTMNKKKNSIALILVLPILMDVQEALRNLYQNKINSSEFDKLTKEYGEEAKAEEDEDNDKLQQLKDAIDNETDEAKKENLQKQYDQLQEEITERGFDMDMLNKYEQKQSQPNASKHITITLKKIQASDDLDVLQLDSDYLPGDTLDDIDEILNQEEFQNVLTEDPQSFAIEVDDDGFDIEPCEECIECSPCESLCEVFKSGIRAYRNLYILHWMSSGNDMMKLHNLSEEMYEELQSEIDTIGELLVEKQGTVPQLDFACDYIPVQQYDFQTGLDQIKSLIQMYIDCIDYAYCNQTSDVQSTLDEWLRYWNKQLNYFVKGQEM